ncbi:MAG TPA: hypothetical protein VES19_01260 [Candidatus Limnocylindrales bacterium]|nr:hypothetical protein [Candidatus Limnocylindrales bacterium]
MTSSDLAFLALGLVLGAALGAALVQVLRARPAPRREVRLTITPNAIPARHAHTLAIPYTPMRPAAGPGATPSGALAATPHPTAPASAVAASAAARLDGPGASRTRTRVPSRGVVLPASAVAIPVGGPSATTVPDLVRDTRPGVMAPRPPQNGGSRASAGSDAPVALAVGTATAVAVLDAPARPWAAVATSSAQAHHPEAFTTLVRPRGPVEAPRPSLAPGAVPVVANPRASVQPPGGSGPGTDNGTPGAPGAASPAGAPGAATDPCSGLRRAVDERCALAGVAREQARRGADVLREAQRAYDVLRDQVDRAGAQADPRHVVAAKERLHAAFRAAGDRAGTADETESAARSWLNEINALNNAVREARRIVEAGSAELRLRIGTLERLSAEADAARIGAENAESGCREAREELAGCEEADARARQRIAPEPVEPHPFSGVWPEDRPNIPDRRAPTDLLAGLPLVVRVLRGDRDAREHLVATLAAGDADAARDWGLRVSRLADAIIGRAIEDGYLDLPDDDPFWRLFSYPERRDIVGALSALGFRYDGMGGFADGRAPAARDLSLAVGYAGLDRMRIRSWPRDSEIAILYERAVVAADEWLADQAGDLSLGRMVDALGNRAADLADLWNAWGRVRPALLAT